MSPRVYSKKSKVKVASLDSWGWSVFFSQLIIAFGFLIFGLTHFAFADRGFGADGQVSNRNPANTKMNVSGEMNWKNGVGTIKDNSTGRTYTLMNSEGLKSLWESGVKNVSVSGNVGPGNTFVVENLSAP